MKRIVEIFCILTFILASLSVKGNPFTVGASTYEFEQYEREIKNISIESTQATSANLVSSLNDRNMDTHFEMNLEAMLKIKFEPDSNNLAHAGLSKLILYVTNETAENLSGITVKVNANDEGYQQQVQQVDPIWQNLSGVKKVEIDIPLVLCKEIYVEFTGDSEIQVTELVVEGERYLNDLDNQLSFRYNGEIHTSDTMFDYVLQSLFGQVEGLQPNDELIFDFSPATITLTEFLIASNFPNQQSIKEGTLAYWDGFKWVNIEANKEIDYSINYTQARGLGGFRFQEITTSKLRLIVDECNTYWNKTIIQEILMKGSVNSNSEPISHENMITGSVMTSSMESISGEVANIYDGDEKTSWTTSLSNDSVIEMSIQGTNEERFSNYRTDKIVIYARGEIPNNMTASVDQLANSASYYQEIKAETELLWEQVGLLKMAEIIVPVSTVSSVNRLKFKGSGQLEIVDIIVEGIGYDSDLASFATAYKNQELIPNNHFFDTHLNTPYGGLQKNDQVVFDFSPFKYALDAFEFTMNFPKSQSVKAGSLDYWDGAQWIPLSADKQFDWKTNNQTREVVGFDFDEIETNKLRLNISAVNDKWSPALQEILLSGNRYIAPTVVARMLSEMPPQMRDATQVIMPALPQVIYELPNQGAIELTIESSSRHDVVDLTGQIEPPVVDTQVMLMLRVSNLITGESAVTEELQVLIPAKTPVGYRLTTPEEDTISFIKNPYMGWVAYIEYYCSLHDEKGQSGCIDAHDTEKFFEKLDEEIGKGLKPSILYMRMGWQWFEPNKGEYAWRNPTSNISKLIEGAKERELQIAFRILSADDSFGADDEDIYDPTQDDKTQTLPPWLIREPGFNWYRNNEGNRTPYYDNATYIHHYENLIKELAKDFNNPNLVAYMDAQGLGTWGEMHDVRVEGRWSKNQTIREHAKIWTKYFDKVLLGATFGGGVNSVNENDIVPNYQHMIRRDGFGSKWLSSYFINMYLTKFFPQKIPSYGEGAYWHFSREGYLERFFSQDSLLGYTGNDAVDYRKYFDVVIGHAQQLRANTLDARVPSDWPKWTQYGNDLIDKFAIENGYRLVPTSFYYSENLERGMTFSIQHQWKNTAVGFLPTANNQLKDKYKIAFALLDTNNQVVHQVTDNNIDPSWIKEDEVLQLSTVFDVPTEINQGTYKLAVAVVDKDNDEKPGISLATKMEMIDVLQNTDDPKTWYGGWYVINEEIIVN